MQILHCPGSTLKEVDIVNINPARDLDLRIG
jgi:hypothetical protein